MHTHKYFDIGIVSLLLGLYIALLGLFIGQSILYTIASLFIVISPLLMLKDIHKDIKEAFNASFLSLSLLMLFIFIYILLRYKSLDFSFMMGDASDYYWAGVSSVLNGNTIGRFLPLSDALAGVGFKSLGYTYLPYIITYVSFNTYLILYVLSRKIGISVFLSFIFVFLLQCMPLSIWFSKSTYSEPIWQVLILLSLYSSLKLIQTKHISFLSLFAFYALIFLLPMSRGSAVLFYAILIFISLYHFWLYAYKKSAVLITVSLFVLSSAIVFTLIERTTYLIVWQYSRLIYGITVETLTTVFYSLSFVYILLLFILFKFWKSYHRMNFPVIIVLLSVLFKISIALFFSIKKELSFIDLLYQNEIGFLGYHFGIFLSFMIVFGLGFLVYSAIKGDKFALILIVFYSIFTIPFTMQGASISDFHTILLYWHRYYFSELFIIHIFALLYAIRFISDYLQTLAIQKRTIDILIATSFCVLFCISIDTKLLKIVSTEGYMEKSSTFYSWLKEKSQGKKVTIFYDKKLRYPHKSMQQLIEKGLRNSRIYIRGYYKSPNEKMYDKFKYSSKYTKKDMLLVMSATERKVDTKNIKLVDTLYLPLTYRYNIEDVHKNKIIYLNIYLYLYTRL